MVRAAPEPMLWTPEISRAAIPAILATTESAMVVLPWSVTRPPPPPEEDLVLGELDVVVSVIGKLLRRCG